MSAAREGLHGGGGDGGGGGSGEGTSAATSGRPSAPQTPPQFHHHLLRTPISNGGGLAPLPPPPSPPRVVSPWLTGHDYSSAVHSNSNMVTSTQSSNTTISTRSTSAGATTQSHSRRLQLSQHSFFFQDGTEQQDLIDPPAAVHHTSARANNQQQQQQQQQVRLISDMEHAVSAAPAIAAQHHVCRKINCSRPKDKTQARLLSDPTYGYCLKHAKRHWKRKHAAVVTLQQEMWRRFVARCANNAKTMTARLKQRNTSLGQTAGSNSYAAMDGHQLVHLGIPMQWRTDLWVLLCDCAKQRSRHPPGYYQDLAVRVANDIEQANRAATTNPATATSSTCSSCSTQIVPQQQELHDSSVYRNGHAGSNGRRHSDDDEYMWVTQTVAEILKDVPRTMPQHRRFGTRDMRAALVRLLSMYAIHNPKIGYCQSMNFVAGFVLLHYQHNEEAAFWLLDTIIGRLRPDGYYSGTLLGVRTDCRVFKALLTAQFPKLCEHLTEHSVDVSIVVLPWFLCLFVNSLRLQVTARVWDVFLLEGMPAIFAVALSLFSLYRQHLLDLTEAGDLQIALHKIGRDVYDSNLLMSLAANSYAVKWSTLRDMRNEFRDILIAEDLAVERHRQALKHRVLADTRAAGNDSHENDIQKRMRGAQLVRVLRPQPETEQELRAVVNMGAKSSWNKGKKLNGDARVRRETGSTEDATVTSSRDSVMEAVGSPMAAGYCILEDHFGPSAGQTTECVDSAESMEHNAGGDDGGGSPSTPPLMSSSSSPSLPVRPLVVIVPEDCHDRERAAATTALFNMVPMATCKTDDVALINAC